MNISTTRGDDPEDVRENQRRIAGAIGVQPEDMTFTNQTHTTNVAVVKAGDKGKRFQETDGMITDVRESVWLHFTQTVCRCILLIR